MDILKIRTPRMLTCINYVNFIVFQGILYSAFPYQYQLYIQNKTLPYHQESLRVLFQSSCKHRNPSCLAQSSCKYRKTKLFTGNSGFGLHRPQHVSTLKNIVYVIFCFLLYKMLRLIEGSFHELII